MLHQHRRRILISRAAGAICCVAAAFAIAASSGAEEIRQAKPPVLVKDRMWLWGHVSGIYNEYYLTRVKMTSRIEPVEACDFMGLQNMMFIHWDATARPNPPYTDYYVPFKKLDRVIWSLTGAGGSTSPQLREDVYKLAEDNKNIVGFILDDFFHESGDINNMDRQYHWLADNNATFPVDLTLTAPDDVACDRIELQQVSWHSGDYRTKDFLIEVPDGEKSWRTLAKGRLPNLPGATLKIKIPRSSLRTVRLRLLSTYDTAGAFSCGLRKVQFFAGDEAIDTGSWKATASSTFPTHDPQTIVRVVKPGEIIPYRASMTPEELKAFRDRPINGETVPITLGIYTTQLSPRAKAHLEIADQAVMFTWRPADLAQLEENLSKLEKLVQDKPILLGCYLFDFDVHQPIPLDAMKNQAALGLKWLKEGRIAGMVFLASPVVDLDLEAVKWTRRWIAEVGNEKLPQRTN
jgi:hypothetical protein